MQTAEQVAVIVTAQGSATLRGQQVTGPVNSIDRMAQLIEYCWSRGYLLPQPSTDPERETLPPQVWFVGVAACRPLGWIVETSPELDAVREVVQRAALVTPQLTTRVAESIAPLIATGWQMRGSGHRFELSRGPITVEVVLEPYAWTGTASDDLGVLGIDDTDTALPDDDQEAARELGRRILAWTQHLGIAPMTSGAAAGAAVLDRIRHRRIETGRGLVVSDPGRLPDVVVPEYRVQPAWTAAPSAIERAFDHAQELVIVERLCPKLAAAGMLALGHGRPLGLRRDAATAAAGDAKHRPFGLWEAVLPAAETLDDLVSTLPLPDPRMQWHTTASAWLTTSELKGLCQPVRDGGAGVAIEDLAIARALVWPAKGRALDTYAAEFRTARDEFANDPVMRAIAESASEDYLDHLDHQQWNDDSAHHLQPAWRAEIAGHVRFRMRYAAMKIAGQYYPLGEEIKDALPFWPIHIDETTLVYALPFDKQDRPIDVAETNDNLGRVIVTQRTPLTDDTINAVLLADTPEDLTRAIRTAFEPISSSPTEVAV